MEVISFVALAAGLIIGLGAVGACIGIGIIDAAFIIGTGIALWFATANPFLAQIANLPK